jgi:hypothetical protein
MEPTVNYDFTLLAQHTHTKFGDPDNHDLATQMKLEVLYISPRSSLSDFISCIVDPNIFLRKYF